MVNSETTRRGPKFRTIATLALLATVLPTTLLATVLPAQDSVWTKMRTKTKTKPATRYGHAMAYDASRQVVVMFGGIGENGTVWLDETWEWNGSKWSQKNPVHKPSGRFCPGAMAYDGEVCVLFGGSEGGNGQGVKNDTWTWNGTDWTEKSPGTSPPARHSQAMAHDATNSSGRVVLFGGSTVNGSQADTWAWDGNAGTNGEGQWSNVTPTNSPLETAHHTMAYDSNRQRVVMFGGRAPNYDLRGETWEWDGSAWLEVLTNPANSPAKRCFHAMAYDSNLQRVVMFGGFDEGSSQNADFLNDSWKWNGTSWTELTFPAGRRNKPPVIAPPRIFHAMAYDAARGVTMVFGSWAGGGLAVKDTWVLDAN